MVRLDDVTVFVRTADRGSLSAAARELEISPALASAAVKRLEGELGIRLFARTTRSLRLTDEGERYLRHARDALRALQDGHDALADATAEIALVWREGWTVRVVAVDAPTAALLREALAMPFRSPETER